MKPQTYNKLKKILHITLSVLAACAFVVLLGAASKYQEQQGIKEIHFKIISPNKVSALSKGNIEKWIMSGSPEDKLIGKRNDEINLSAIENRVLGNPWVSDAEVFIDHNHNLWIEVYERSPIARIFAMNGESFFMDSVLAEMPLIPEKTFSLPVFTNVFIPKSDSLASGLKSKISFMAELIGKDSFWSAQVAQIVVNPNQSFTLIPVIGEGQKIIFGDTSNAHQKLDNLMDFYKEVSPKVGWESYKVLDIRFENQVIAKPSLGVTMLKTGA